MIDNLREWIKEKKNEKKQKKETKVPKKSKKSPPNPVPNPQPENQNQTSVTLQEPPPPISLKSEEDHKEDCKFVLDQPGIDNFIELKNYLKENNSQSGTDTKPNSLDVEKKELLLQISQLKAEQLRLDLQKEEKIQSEISLRKDIEKCFTKTIDVIQKENELKALIDKS